MGARPQMRVAISPPLCRSEVPPIIAHNPAQYAEGLDDGMRTAMEAVIGSVPDVSSKNKLLTNWRHYQCGWEGWACSWKSR